MLLIFLVKIFTQLGISSALSFYSVCFEVAYTYVTPPQLCFYHLLLPGIILKVEHKFNVIAIPRCFQGERWKRTRRRRVWNPRWSHESNDNSPCVAECARSDSNIWMPNETVLPKQLCDLKIMEPADDRIDKYVNVRSPHFDGNNCSLWQKHWATEEWDTNIYA